MKVRRLPLIDEYVEDDRSAVYVDDRVLVLSELATFALGLMTEEWSDADRLAEALVDHFGAPPEDAGAVASTEAMLGQLADEGLLQIA